MVAVAQPGDGLDADFFGLEGIDQPAERAGDGERLRRAGKQRLRQLRVRIRLRPLQGQARQQQLALQGGGRRRNFQGRRIRSPLAEVKLVFVDVAQGTDARQELHRRAARLEEPVRQLPCRAARRQQHLVSDQRHRIGGRGPRRREGAGQDHARQQVQERRPRRHREHARRPAGERTACEVHGSGKMCIWLDEWILP